MICLHTTYRSNPASTPLVKGDWAGFCTITPDLSQYDHSDRPVRKSEMTNSEFTPFKSVHVRWLWYSSLISPTWPWQKRWVKSPASGRGNNGMRCFRHPVIKVGSGRLSKARPPGARSSTVTVQPCPYVRILASPKGVLLRGTESSVSLEYQECSGHPGDESWWLSILRVVAVKGCCFRTRSLCRRLRLIPRL